MHAISSRWKLRERPTLWYRYKLRSQCYKTFQPLPIVESTMIIIIIIKTKIIIKYFSKFSCNDTFYIYGQCQSLEKKKKKIESMLMNYLKRSYYKTCAAAAANSVDQPTFISSYRNKKKKNIHI